MYNSPVNNVDNVDNISIPFENYYVLHTDIEEDDFVLIDKYI